MKTIINHINNDWVNIKNKCRTTVNKNYTEHVPSSKFKTDLLISEHSPIRLLEIDWSWKNIKYWVSTEWSRHKWEKFISSQRTDRTGIDRNKNPQDAPVKFDGYANAQNLIDTFRKRLCNQASPEARELAEDFKIELHKYEPELADMLVPNCIYRCGCPEFPDRCECKYFQNFVKQNMRGNLFSIRDRYKYYNEWFYKIHGDDKNE